MKSQVGGMSKLLKLQKAGADPAQANKLLQVGVGWVPRGGTRAWVRKGQGPGGREPHGQEEHIPRFGGWLASS